MKAKKEVINYVNYYSKGIGIEKLKEELSNTINDLSEDGGAIDNINQIKFFVDMLFYIRYEYKKNNQ